MILTLLVLIFVFRIRYPILYRLKIPKSFKLQLDLLYVGLFLFFLLVFRSFDLKMASQLSLFLSVILQIPFFYFLKRKYEASLLQSIEECCRKCLYKMRLGDSFYSSLKFIVTKTEAFKQQNDINIILSVLFAQQKPSDIVHFKEFIRFLSLIEDIQAKHLRAADYLEVFLQSLLKEKKLAEKKRTIGSHIGAQVVLIFFLFCFLGLFQNYFWGTQTILTSLKYSVTFFVIGLTGIFLFWRVYI